MTDLTDADDFTVTEATKEGTIKTHDVTDDVTASYWDKKGQRLYIDGWHGKLDKFDLYVDLETETARCGNDAWEEKLSADVEGDEIHVVCDEGARPGPSEKVHELTIEVEGVDAEGDQEDAGPEVATDGGQDASAHVDDETIEAAIESHDDPSHPDAMSVEDVRDLLAHIQRGVEELWTEWLDNIERGETEVIADTGDLLVLDTGEHRIYEQELEPYAGEVTVDDVAISLVSEVHHELARRHTDRNWGTTYPVVVRKPDGFEDGQRFVEAVVNGLQRRGCSPGQAWAYYGTEIRGESASSWAKRCGYTSHSSVSEAKSKAEQKL